MNENVSPVDVRQWLAYDAWAIAELLDAVQRLTHAQFVHEFAKGLSVRHQFAHLLIVTDRYLARLAHEPVPDLSPEDFTTVQELVVYEAAMRRRLNTWSMQLSARDLTAIRQHETRRGDYRATAEQTIYHTVNHSTYHRGQIACLLKLHGVDFADTDFIIWINRDAA